MIVPVSGPVSAAESAPTPTRVDVGAGAADVTGVVAVIVADGVMELDAEMAVVALGVGVINGDSV